MLRYSIDEVNSDRILGWAFDPDEPPEVTVVIAGKPVGQARMGTYRIDVAQSLGDGRAATSGFEYRFDAEAFRHVQDRQATVELQVGPERVAPVAVPVVVPSGRGAVPRPVPAGRRAAPAGLHRCLRRARLERRRRHRRRERSPIPRRARASRRARAPPLPVLRRAALGAGGSRRAVLPARQHRRRSRREGRVGRAEFPPLEVFSVGLHLATLASAGVPGDFLEFGCFKGFSTAILSEACDRLGLTMHVFDSFAGLPPSDSHYYSAGDFTGSLPEVARNVETYGFPRSVTYHEGFFSDTLPSFHADAVAAIWMDVDLESSSRDVMAVLPQLNPRGVLFSHECSPEMFVGAEIRTERGADFVVPPILDAFEALGWPVRGRHIHGHTGAFWHAEQGIPPVPFAASTALRDLALEL